MFLKELVKRKIYLVLFPILLIILELMPNGAVLKFADAPENGKITFSYNYYSYFSSTPFGYASFGPLLTVALTLAILVLLIIYFISINTSLLKTVCYLSFIAFLASILPVIFGLDYITIIGIIISALILGLWILIIFLLRKH